MPTQIIGTTGIDKVQDGSIGTDDLAAGAVTTSKIADANVTPGKLAQPLTLGTAQNTTSGTSIDFNGIPSWVKRITVMFNGVSTNGSSVPQVQLGAGSFTTTGYLGTAQVGGGSGLGANFATGFPLSDSAAATVRHGLLTIAHLGNNVWAGSSVIALSQAGTTWSGGSSVTLSGVLDRLRLTTVNGTDTFDAGSVNILYE